MPPSRPPWSQPVVSLLPLCQRRTAVLSPHRFHWHRAVLRVRVSGPDRRLPQPFSCSGLARLLCSAPAAALSSHWGRAARFSSSLGTAEQPHAHKAGARRFPDSSGSLGVRHDAGEAAAEQSSGQQPQQQQPHEGKQEAGVTRWTEADIRQREEREEQTQQAAARPRPSEPQTQPQPPPAAVPSSPPAGSASSPSSSSKSAAPASLSFPAWSGAAYPASFLLPPAPPSSPLLRGVLWFDCVYPMQAHWLDLRHLLASHNHEQLIPAIVPEDVEIVSMIPRVKEGGVFVQFEARRGDAYDSAEAVAQAVILRLRQRPVRARLTTRPVHCHLVKGEPFLEDLLSRFPSARLKVEVKGGAQAMADLTLEHLYAELRAFGRINDLVLAPYVKEQPRQASVQYRRMHGAVGARNCLHRLSIPVATVPPSASPPQQASLFFTYDSVLKTSYIIDFAQKHPRLLVPLLGLLFAAFTFLIFDPLRSFNVVNKITGRFTIAGLSRHGPLPFLRLQLSRLFQHRIFDVFKHESEQTVVRSSWSAREADEAKVVKWLNAVPDRLLFITGAKGAGKQALVKAVTADRRNVVSINFAQFIDRNDEEFVRGPGFSLLTWVSSLMDIFTPGAGKASGAATAQFSSQLQKILEVTTDALVSIDSRQRRRVHSNDAGQVVEEQHHDRTEQLRNRVMELVRTGEATSSPNPRKIESGKQQERNKPEILGQEAAGGSRSKDAVSDSKDNGLINTDQIAARVADSGSQDRSAYSDSIPLFIIDGFSPDNAALHNNFMAAFVQFAAQMTSAQLARFLFLTDSTLEESVSKSMPDIKLQEVSLSDADTDSALQFVMNSVSPVMKQQMTEERREETKRAVGILGGRYSDLLSLVRQLESGASPVEAAEEIVSQSCGIVKSLMFSEQKDARWSRVQLWQTVTLLTQLFDRSLAANGGDKATAKDWLGYDDVLFNVFQGDDAALRGLVRVDLLRVEGRGATEQDRLRAGSPVLLEAFRRLRASDKFCAGMDVLTAKAMVEKEQKKVGEYEEEIAKIGRLEADYAQSEAAAGGREKRGWWGETDTERERRRMRVEMTARRGYLLDCLHDSHDKILKFDLQRREGEARIKQISMQR